ncbi:hypothetical protein GQ53DRAFT_240704 [Thozetella sp. PMI_491]|nr:hypothetical protein GQ53DRAFT_240704 [Thozetella sp. PMI_491]
MLSNPHPVNNNLHSRQRMHRRQNSTPSAFEAVRIAPLPNFQQQQQQPHRPNVSHRRGLSLDTRRQQLSPTTATTTTRQDFTTVSTTTTNPGLATTPQHVLQEAQQQRIARPGHGQPNNFGISQADSENFLLSPHSTPHSQRFADAMAGQGTMQGMGIPFDAYMGPMGAVIKKNQANFAQTNAMVQPQDFELFAPDSALSTPTFMTFPEASPGGAQQGWASEGETTSTHARRSSRRISNGIMDKVARYEALDGGPSRPITPPNQNAQNYFPPTPMETPHDRMVKQEQQRPRRFADGYDESMEETLKPVRGNRSSNRNSAIFQEMRQQAEGMVPASPGAMGFAPAPSMSTANFMNMNSVNAEFGKIENQFDGLPVGMSSLSQHSSPMTPALAYDPFENRPDFRHQDFDSQATMRAMYSPTHGASADSSRRASPHRRTESLASIASAASIASLNIDETKTETGITMDDIAIYIEGPDPKDGKWVCTYEGCKKRFGRKENIKSHVQTHLNDRQYQCPSCHKCFVRQHDLKRHAKIHTGIKPYPCECGNSFARHDALTRHRQRGMCIGAFDGIVRKVVKRGRPRKHRPELDERRDKSDRTRRKNKVASSCSSACSQSGYSDSSAVNSPINDFDHMLDDKPFPDIMDVAMDDAAPLGIPTSVPMDPSSFAVSSAPMPSLRQAGELVTVVSPEQINSPSAMSSYSQVSRASIGGDPRAALADAHHGLPDTTAAASPAKSVASHYTHLPGTPPELSASSSPPATGVSTRFFDLDPNSSGLSDASIGLGTTAAVNAAAAGVSCGVSGVSMQALAAMDDEMLLQAFAHEDGLVPLDREGLMLGGKFDDDYDAVNMFTNGDDIFFGTS